MPWIASRGQQLLTHLLDISQVDAVSDLEGFADAGREAAFHLAGLGTRTVTFAASSFLSTANSVVTFFISFFVFWSLLFYLLKADQDWVSGVLTVFPKPMAVRIHEALAKSVQSVFIVNGKLCLYHALYTWILYRVFDAHFAYTTSLLSAISAILPLVPPILVPLPAAIEIWIRFGWVRAIAIYSLHIGWLVSRSSQLALGIALLPSSIYLSLLVLLSTSPASAPFFGFLPLF